MRADIVQSKEVQKAEMVGHVHHALDILEVESPLTSLDVATHLKNAIENIRHGTFGLAACDLRDADNARSQPQGLAGATTFPLERLRSSLRTVESYPVQDEPVFVWKTPKSI
jgi:hypothetical protein